VSANVNFVSGLISLVFYCDLPIYMQDITHSMPSGPVSGIMIGIIPSFNTEEYAGQELYISSKGLASTTRGLSGAGSWV
jgi:hypothetical protein